MKILEIIKAHPYTTGAIVVGGGLAFILISGIGRESSTPVVVGASSAQSDAEVQAGATIQAAQIAAQAQAVSGANNLEVAKLQADLGLHQLDVGADVSKATLVAQVQGARLSAETSIASDYFQSATLLGMTALQNPITNTTTSKSSGGLFGGLLGGGKKSTTTTVTAQDIPLPDLASVLNSFSNIGTGSTTNPTTGVDPHV